MVLAVLAEEGEEEEDLDLTSWVELEVLDWNFVHPLTPM